jgi:hypothetical protein|tara:strand:+ start:1651 stop:3009 length:1359 start_codon:yes stop_codon:yes gene_type:complete
MKNKFIQNVLRAIAGLLWLTIFAFLLWPDSKPDQDHENWISVKLPDVPEQENAFFSIAGFVSKQQDAHKTGIEYVRRHNDIIKKFARNDIFNSFEEAQEEIDKIWGETEDQSLDLLIDQFCKPELEKNCLPAWQKNRDKIDEAVLRYEFHVTRYLALHDFSQYQNDISPSHFHEPHYFRMIIQAQLLLLAQAGSQFTIQPDASGKFLQEDMEFSRMIFEQSDSLLDQIKAFALFRNALAVRNSLIMTYPQQAGLEKLGSLDVAGPNFAAIMRREAKYMIYSAETFKSAEWTMSILYPLLYKKNMTRGKISEIYQQFAQWSKLTPTEFYSLDDQISYAEPAPIDYFTDPIGSVYGSLAIPDYGAYLGYIHDLNGEIALSNLLLHAMRADISDAELEAFGEHNINLYHNPYTGGAFTWKDQNKMVCFQGYREEKCIRRSKGTAPAKEELDNQQP